ncbi:MAG: penicillin-binding protein 1A [Bryobacteraceae bacterium]
MRLHISRTSLLMRLLMHPAGKVLLALASLLFVGGLLTFTYYYARYSRLVDSKLRTGPFQSTAMIFAAPQTVSVGDAMSLEDIVSQLQRSGYTDVRANPLGWYNLRDNAIEIFPGPDSYFDQEGGVIYVAGERVSRIISTRDNTDRTQYMLEPELLTNLFDKNREKRRLVKFKDLPQVLIHAVISAEDKRFFQHSGFDPFRVIKAAYVDLKEGRIAEGASTLSMQLARMFWLNQAKTWKRKAAEVLITFQIEQKLTKEEIFEYYANQIDLGRRGSFSIRGFGEAAQAYLGKDVRDLTVAEAAMLAGLAQRPSYTSPIRWPERAKARRNVVLGLMKENGYITEQQYAEAVSSPLTVARSGAESADAPYFVDLVNDELQDEFQQHDFQDRSYRVYTTLDMDLQREASEAVRIGMKEVDDQVRQQRRFRGGKPPEAQVALVALDPQTAEVKALVGGRNYGVSQLNHVLAKRQPGSSFKPFVYAAALETSLTASQKPITSLLTIADEPTTFWFDDKPYSPANFKDEYHGTVTLRQAIAHSMNVPTVKLAEMIGYDRIVDLAKRAGMNLNIQPTPAVALGAYEVTPIEIAGAYTVFANQGIYTKPSLIKLIRDEKGSVLHTNHPVRRQVLDPRIAYLMVDLLQEVLRSGTGVGVRARGFTLPAAGKTGTSHDGWFAGFTSRLICIVWVGFDDNQELEIEGARAALPIWTEFMKRAHRHREYRNAMPFEPPDGIVMARVDPATGSLATSNCPKAEIEAFVAGTEPIEGCRLHGGSLASATQVTGWETPSAEGPAEVASAAKPAAAAGSNRSRRPAAASAAAKAPAAPVAPPPEKKGLFRRILDVFK